jgi:hypothetical protein
MQPNGHCRLIARSPRNSKIYFGKSPAKGHSLGTIPEFFFAVSGLTKRAGWMGKSMNASFYFLDRATHIKIVLLAAALAGMVVAVGESARGGHAAAPAMLMPPTPAQPAQSLKTLSAPVVAKSGTRQT